MMLVEVVEKGSSEHRWSGGRKIGRVEEVEEWKFRIVKQWQRWFCGML